MNTSSQVRLLVNFAHNTDYIDFIIPELQSLFEIHGVKYEFDPDFLYNPLKNPVAYINFTNVSIDDLNQLCSRAVLTKNFVQVYSEGNSVEDALNRINPADLVSERDCETSYKFYLDPRGLFLDNDKRLSRCDDLFLALNLKGKVDLKNALRTFILIEDNWNQKVYVGKIVAGLVDDRVCYYSKFSLNKRVYLGPTTTDVILAFLMANLGQVQASSLVLDPFVGTGGLLIPAAYFKAHIYGSDIDIRVLKGYGVGYTKPEARLGRKEKTKKVKENNVFTNFKHYGLSLPEIIRADINQPSFRLSELFDSIVCDPPYGHRAFQRETGVVDQYKPGREERVKKRNERRRKAEEAMKKKEEGISEESNEEILKATVNAVQGENSDSCNEDEENYAEEKPEEDPQKKEEEKEKDPSSVLKTSSYAPLKKAGNEQIFESLINLGDNCLKPGGLLVFLYPTSRESEEENYPVNFPKSSKFKLLKACENSYATKKSRWCLVYKKVTQ